MSVIALLNHEESALRKNQQKKNSTVSIISEQPSYILNFTPISLKYTRAPQTMHNTPVMNILKGYFYKNSCQILLSHVKLAKTQFSQVLLRILLRKMRQRRGFAYNVIDELQRL